MCLVLMLSVIAVSAVSTAAVDTAALADTAAEGLAQTGADADIQSTGAITPVNLGDSFYARISMIKYSDYYLTVPSSPSSSPVLRKSNEYNTQIWHFTRDGSTYRIRSVSNNLYVEMNGSEVKEGSALLHAAKRNAAEQKWLISKDSTGYRIHSSVDDSFVMICVNPTASTSRIVLTNSATNARAYFKFEKLSYTSDLLDTPSFKTSNTIDGVKLSWSKVKNAKQYRVYRYNDSTKQWKALSDVSETTYTDKTVTSGTTYKYTVKTISPLLSKYETKSIKFIAAPVVSVNNTATGPVISWKKVTGAEKYRVFVHNGTKWKIIGTTEDTSFLHKNFEYNKTYKYTVRCLSADGKTFTSAYNTDGVSNTIVPALVVTAKVMPFSIDLSWKKSALAASYKIYIKTKENNWKWDQLAVVKTNTYSYTDAVSNNSYYFTVRALDASGKLISSFQSTAIVNYYEAPCVYSISSTSGGNKISWYPIDGAAQYRVFAWNGAKWVKRGDTPSYTTTYTAAISGTDNQNICYAVRCLDKNGSYISYYLETVIESDLRYYYPGEYTSTHKF